MTLLDVPPSSGSDALPPPAFAPPDPTTHVVDPADDAAAASTPDDEPAPAWYRPALGAILAVTTVAYLWGLSASGYANSFYSAAAQAGSQSWKAWFFGSFDASNAITVDKPPAAMWVMGLSV